MVVSRLGMESRRVVAWVDSAGRAVRSEERWEDEATRAALERAARDWRERRLECVDCRRDWGSVDVREVRGRVDRRERYLLVVGWLGEG